MAELIASRLMATPFCALLTWPELFRHTSEGAYALVGVDGKHCRAKGASLRCATSGPAA